MIARPKFKYVRSEKLMRAYREIPCQHCGASDGTVCGAHSNWSDHGKGRSIKASDVYAASMCSVCHFQLDQGFLWDAKRKREIWEEAHRKTVTTLVRLGLWPDGIEVPAL